MGQQMVGIHRTLAQRCRPDAHMTHALVAKIRECALALHSLGFPYSDAMPKRRPRRGNSGGSTASQVDEMPDASVCRSSQSSNASATPHPEAGTGTSAGLLQLSEDLL